jgi:hypothetical protein
MFTLLRRVIGYGLLAWFAFIMYSLVTAARRRSDAPPQPPADSDDPQLVAVFDELNFRSTAPALRHATVETRFGGGVLDLTEATLDPAGATLEIKAVFGGGQLIVPETWRVTSTVKGIGGVGDTRSSRDLPPDAPHLTIEGTVVFGGWGIASELPKKAADSGVVTEAPTA